MRSNFSMWQEHIVTADEYITMTKGDTLSFGLEVTDQDGDGIDLETAYFTCKKNLSEIVFQKSLGDGITQTGDGEYVVRVAPEDTESLLADRYFYDLQLGVNGDIFTFKKGVLEIADDATE